ncbi:MAG: hypothetical protein H6905_09215 [Hyphomicrobiales bacterium]|nr:hypothetical protein [Hyphomicrobiales bacterium]
MQRPLILSLLIHLTVLILVLVVFPVFDRDSPVIEQPVVVDLVELTETTNPPPPSVSRAEPEPQPPTPPKRKETEPIEAPKVEKVVPAPVPKPAEQIVEQPASKPEPAPEPKASPAPEPPPKRVAQKDDKPLEQNTMRPKIKPKPEAKASSADEPPERQTQQSDFSSVLKTIEELKRSSKSQEKTVSAPTPETPRPSLEEQVARALGQSSDQPHDSRLDVSMSEIDAVRRQIGRCWNLPAGAKRAEDLIVAIRVEMNVDGTPRSATIERQESVGGNPFYQAAAESALRAVLNPRCHPFKLPPEKYQTWRTMTLVFNPKEMFGT